MSSKGSGFKNIPPPPGSKGASAYARFIPREELGEVTSWDPGVLGDRRKAPRGPHPAQSTPDAAPPRPAEPTADEWRARIAAARHQGYQEGYRDGLAALENFKHSFAAQATAQVGALIEGFDAQFAALDQRLAQTVTQVAVRLARNVLRAELQINPAVVAAVAAEAVNAVMLSARHISVHVHPDDLPLVADGAQEALRARGARLQPDPEIERGGVLVVSDVGAVDAAVDTRWAQAAAALGVESSWQSPAGAQAGDDPPQAAAQEQASDGPATPAAFAQGNAAKAPGGETAE